MSLSPQPLPAPGILYLVATPIGNLEDITARALRVLREVDTIAAEDTRVTRKLLAHFDIHTPLTAYHAHSTDGAGRNLLALLAEGKSVALVSDAGTPCISDPGAELVAQAIEVGVRVEPIPGACAAIAGLVGSGLPTGRFVFEGFLPRSRADRREQLLAVAHERRTVVLYESPHHLNDTLSDLRKVCGDERQIAVGRELTKRFEEFVRGSLAEVDAHFAENAPRGECVLVLQGANDAPPDPANDANDTLDTQIGAALAKGLSQKDAAREVAKATGLARNQVYAEVLRRAQGGPDTTPAPEQDNEG